MDASILEPWRDLAIILLAIYAAMIVAVPGAILFFMLRGIRALKRWIRMPLLNAHVWTLRIQNTTLRISRVLVGLPIALQSAEVRISATARGIIDFLLGF